MVPGRWPVSDAYPVHRSPGARWRVAPAGRAVLLGRSLAPGYGPRNSRFSQQHVAQVNEVGFDQRLFFEQFTRTTLEHLALSSQ